MSESLSLWGVEAAAQQLTQEITRALPVTFASVALWDQPSFSLTVKAVSALRPLPQPLTVGARVPLSAARWHRAVFERQEPVFLEQDSAGDAMSREELSLALVPELRSVYLIPILFSGEAIGVLALGEMRSRERAAFTEEKRRRCRAILEEFLAASAHAWEAGHLRRQVRTMSSLLQIAREMLEVRSHEDVMACLAARVSDWLGMPVKGILLRAQAASRMEIIARWQLPEAETEADGLLLALVRAEGQRRGPISVVNVTDDPLDPLHAATMQGEAWTRVCLPLLRGDRLLGIGCLYVADELYPSDWELEAFRWLSDVTAVGMEIVVTLEEQRAEREWLGHAAWELLTTHQRTVLQEALAGVEGVIASRLPARLERAAELEGGAPDSNGDWGRLAGPTAVEVAAVLAELREAGGLQEESAFAPLEINQLVRRAVEIARGKWDEGPRRRGVPVQLSFEPSQECLVAGSSVALVSALVHAIANAVEALPEGGHIRVRTHRDNGHVLVSVADTGPGVADEHRQRAFAPFFSTKGKPHLGLGLPVVRALAARHGGDVELLSGDDGGTTLVLRLPAAEARR